MCYSLHHTGIFFKDNNINLNIQEPTLGFEPRMSFLAALQEQCNTIMRSRLIIRTPDGIRTHTNSFRRRMHFRYATGAVVVLDGIEPSTSGVSSQHSTSELQHHII